MIRINSLGSIVSDIAGGIVGGGGGIALFFWKSAHFCEGSEVTGLGALAPGSGLLARGCVSLHDRCENGFRRNLSFMVCIEVVSVFFED